MKFIISKAYGSVRECTDTIVGETEAAGPEEALKPFMKEDLGDYVLHEDSRRDTYARIENPISFISDAIDNYSARAGEIIRNEAGHIQFAVEFFRVEGLMFEAAAISNQEVWAVNAEEAVRQCLKPDQQDWVMAEDTLTELNAMCIKPAGEPGIPGERYQARPLVRYADQEPE